MRKDMFEFSMKKSSESSFEQNALPMKPLTIFDFKRMDDAADARAIDVGSGKGGWRISDDEVIGGFSRAKFDLVDTTSSSTTKETSSSPSSSSPSPSSIQSPFIRWQGNIDTRIGPKSRAKRSGFCAIRCPEFPFGGIPVGNKYNALEVKCRSDGRTYTLNLKVQTYFPDDLYQTLITVQPQDVVELKKKQATHKPEGSSSSSPPSSLDDFISVVLPFQDFLLTSHGMVKAQQRSLDGGVQLQHFGLTLMDGKDGPFQFDLAGIRLVNYSSIDGIIVNDDGDGGGDVMTQDGSIGDGELNKKGLQ